MARKSQQLLKAEQAADEPIVGESHYESRVDTSIPLVNPSPEIPSKQPESTLTEAEQLAAEPEQFTVAKDHKFVGPNGLMTIVRAGKMVDSRHYNLDQLLEQGIVLLPVVKE